MKKLTLIAIMLLVAGTAAYAAVVPAKKVECNVNGKKQLVKTVDACKALGGTVVEAKKVS